MPSELDLPAHLKNQGWKVKIFDKERLEPPHVTILRKTYRWRLDLRSGFFLDASPNPDDVSAELVSYVKEPKKWKSLQEQWDARYPTNRVTSVETEE